jgi:hypothetical protein
VFFFQILLFFFFFPFLYLFFLFVVSSHNRTQDDPVEVGDGDNPDCETLSERYLDAEDLFGDLYTKGTDGCFNFASSLSPLVALVVATLVSALLF